VTAPDELPARQQTRTRPAGASRATAVLALVLAPLLLAAVVGMVLTWPHDDGGAGQRAGLVDAGVEFVGATVTGTRTEQCESTVEDRLPDGSQPDQVPCLKVLATVTSGARDGADIEVWATATLTASDVPEGTRIIVQRYPAADGSPETWAWSDFARGVPLATLALAFVLVTMLVAGWRGLRAIVGLALAFVVLWQYVLPGLIAGEDAVVLALCGSAVIMAVVLYLAHGFSLRTSTAISVFWCCERRSRFIDPTTSSRPSITSTLECSIERDAPGALPLALPEPKALPSPACSLRSS
jgi:hypothetical protein